MKLYPMTGGLKINSDHRPGLITPPRALEVPPELVFNLHSKYGRYQPAVQQGQSIQAQQVIASIPTHDGQQQLHSHFGGLITRADRYQVTVKVDPLASSIQPSRAPHDFAARLAHFGIRGMGGALFHTANKIPSPVKALIINGVECEPILESDALLMTQEPERVIAGIDLMKEALKPEQLFMVINTTTQIGSLATALEQRHITIAKLPKQYPAGGERQIYEQLFGHRLPAHTRLFDRKMLCLNVHTTAAIGDTVQFKPVTRRWVTLAVNSCTQTLPLAIGTPVPWILTQLGIKPDQVHVTEGGRIMGQVLDDINTSAVTAGTTGLLIDLRKPHMPSLPCINCGDCIAPCPEGLLPNQLIRYAQKPGPSSNDMLRGLQLDACIQCGVCDLVCPSHIPLSRTFSSIQRDWRQAQVAGAKATKAKAQYEARIQRLAQPVKPNPPKPKAPLMPTPPKTPGLKNDTEAQKRTLKLKAAKAKRLAREAEKAYLQAKKNLDSIELKAYHDRVLALQAKAQAATHAFEHCP